MAAPLFIAWDVPHEMYTGKDRYETSVMISNAAYPDGAPAVFLVKGDNFPDALAAAPLASAYGGPVVLTPSAGLTPSVVAELQRLDPEHVFITGLSDEVKDEVLAALPGASTATIRGQDRYETAALLAARLAEMNGGVTTFVLASGDSFPDALSVAPLAAENGWPILLTPQAGPLPDATAAEIGELDVDEALVVGTRVAPPQSVTDVVSMVGADRYETSAMVAEYAMGAGSTFAHAGLAKGTNYPDALVVGPYLAKQSGVLLLTRETFVPDPIRAQLSAHKDEIETLDIVGLGSSILDVLRGIR
jgi:putative cell wall-binding protein